MIEKGGDLNNPIFDKILSIGYEFETASIAKLSLVKDNVLLNTDMAGKFLSKLNQKGGNEEEDDEEDEDQDDEDEEEESNDSEDVYALRRQELINFDGYTSESIYSNKKIIYPNLSFQVLNDITQSTFNSYLKNLCEAPVEASVAMQKAQRREYDEDYDSDEDNEELNLEAKNELYTFDTKDKQYKINFEMFDPKDCGTFADVEWLFTYYKPKRSPNVILDTFINAIKNLSYHLSNLETIPGNLTIHFSENDKEIIDKPKIRNLFHYPNTNLYYLQTHRLDESQTIDDICIVPQMTFSCNIENVIDITKEMARDTVRSFKHNSEVADYVLSILERLEVCVNHLFESYNLNYGKQSGFSLEDADPNFEKKIKNYIFLILFKLDRYINNFLQDKTRLNSKKFIYFKDKLYFNSRHKNNTLYEHLKMVIANKFNTASSDDIIKIIHNLIIQEPILEEHLLEQKTNIRKRAFNINNTLDVNNRNYGDPHYSLVSYFQFFENPKNENVRDWLDEADVDVYSTTMDIKNDIVLIELRMFKFCLTTYIGSIADKALLNEMTHGACNRLRRLAQPNINSFTLSAFKQLIKLYERKTKPRTKTRSKLLDSNGKKISMRSRTRKLKSQIIT